MRFRLIFIVMLSMHFASLLSQRIERVHGEYTYHVPENVALEEGRRIALERAKIQALADAFGTTVSQNNSTYVKNINGKSSVDFISLGGSEVKGEWIETIGEPTYKIYYERNMLVVEVYVNGKAREKNGAGVEFDAKVLRNGTDLKFESLDFQNGDDLYLYFKSPVDGYLVVYLLDEYSEQAYCLLPYKDSNGQAYKIRHDVPYVFFSQKTATVNQSEVDEYTITCSRAFEQNTVCAIFSPNVFAKMGLENSDSYMSNQVSLKDFRKWLIKSCTKDLEMQKKNITLKIKK